MGELPDRREAGKARVLARVLDYTGEHPTSIERAMERYFTQMRSEK